MTRRTRRTGPQIPRQRVTLPAAPLIDAAALQEALGASRALLWRWRSVFSFPPCFRDGAASYTMTDSVASWLRARGVEVVRRD